MSQNYEYFGKYILLEKLATGGMAEVWLARAPGAGGIGKFVAIKKILPQFSDNPEFIQMFRDEAAIAMNLSHSNIVSIYEFGQEKNQLFLVMDYVEGRNLRQILNKMKSTQYKFSTEQIIYMVKEVAAGLDHAHRSLNSATGKPLNITHRDMSPQNIMITFEGEVKIVDFGIAKAESQMENTKTGTLKGKFGYMSPEQAEGQNTDLRTDIFSLGICLWELLANDRLFIANNEINTLKKIRECNIPSLSKINPNISVELEKIAMKALTRDRNLRYQTAAAMHRDLNRFLNRQYPDFTPHDFSISVKTIFSDEILDVRKRLIDYAKIPFKATNQSQDIEKTVVTIAPIESSKIGPATHDLSHISNSYGEKKIDSSNKASASSKDGRIDSNSNDPDAITEAPQSTRSNSISLLNIDKSKPGVLDNKLLSQSLYEQINVNPKGPKHNLEDTQVRSSGGGSDSELGISVNSKSLSDDRRSQKIKYRQEASNNTAMNMIVFISFVIITVVVATTFFPKQTGQIKSQIHFLIKDFNLGQLQKTTDAILNQNQMAYEGDETQSPDATLSSDAPVAPTLPNHNSALTQALNPNSLKEKDSTTQPVVYYELVINSIPSGAEIFVDGVSTSKSTPSRVRVPENLKYSITLKLPRFIDFTKTDLTREITGRSLTATLQKAMVAYVDIDVKPHHNAIVTVNGLKLQNEILPISRYAIPSGVPITIRAENPLTGAKSEETVTLREEQRYKVLLQLDNKKRSPAKSLKGN